MLQNGPVGVVSNCAISQTGVSFAGEADCLRLEWVNGLQADRVWPIWTQLEQRLGTSYVTSSKIWTKTWFQHFHDIVDCRFAIGWDGDQPQGVVLVVNSRHLFEGPFRLNTVHLGTAGEPDQDSVCIEDNSLLVSPEWRASFVSAIESHLAKEGSWDRLCLDGFCEDSLGTEIVSMSHFDVRRRPSRYFDLQAARQSGGELDKYLGSSSRSAVRRKLRGIDRSQFEWGDSLPLANQIFSEMVELHRARWEHGNTRGIYSSERFLSYHRQLVEKLVPLGQLVMTRIRLATGETLGCNQLLINNNRVTVYQSGWSSEHMKLSPGLVTDWLGIEESFRRGYDAYDFLAGEGEHKNRLSTSHRDLLWLTRSRPRLKFSLVERIRSFKQFARKLLGENRRKKVSNTMETTEKGTHE